MRLACERCSPAIGVAGVASSTRLALSVFAQQLDGSDAAVDLASVDAANAPYAPGMEHSQSVERCDVDEPRLAGKEEYRQHGSNVDAALSAQLGIPRAWHVAECAESSCGC